MIGDRSISVNVITNFVGLKFLTKTKVLTLNYHVDHTSFHTVGMSNGSNFSTFNFLFFSNFFFPTFFFFFSLSPVGLFSECCRMSLL